MPHYAKYDEYQYVRLRRDRPAVSDHPFTQLDVPRVVTTEDHGIIVLVHDVEHPGYEVEFFDANGTTVDLLTLAEEEIEPEE
jgi:hypothetical protein